MKNIQRTGKKRQRGQKDLNINDVTIYIRPDMPTFEECIKLINPQGLPLEALSYSEKVFLEFCEMYESYPNELKEVVRKW